MRNTGLNDPCPCNSGRKYKQCCQRRDETLTANQRPETASPPQTLQAALAHHQAGCLPQAKAIYHQIIAALTAKTPECTPSKYIEKLFDGYANKFDTHLVRDLEYKIPSELISAGSIPRSLGRRLVENQRIEERC